MSKTVEKNDFENNLKRLKKLVQDLETNDISLDDGISAYQQGLVLAESCLKTLEQSKGKIAEIKKQMDKLVEEELTINE